MSKAVLVCPRNPGDASWVGLRERLECLSERLLPDNIEARSPRCLEHSGVSVVAYNPNGTVLTQRASLMLGKMLGSSPDWWRPGASVPEGTFALFRSDADAVELASDTLASRTIWYVQTDEVFIAATSQRAIVALLGSFEPNETAPLWMLSAGNLGPNNVWDRRLKCLRGDTRLRLDRAAWRLSVEQTPITFQPENLSPEEHKRRLRETLEDVLGSLDLDYSKWALPLSGGYDSRAILMGLGKYEGLQTLTWGRESALKDKQSDAYVAKALAAHFGTEHHYFETDASDEPIETVFRRFLVAGEGRIDHVYPYTDGFETWKRLFEGGTEGVVRGDEGFGWRRADTACDVRRSSGLFLVDDFQNLGTHLPTQSLPEALHQRPGESLALWRDRLYHGFRVPSVLAALSDLTCPYVELFNPLITGRLVKQVRTLPDELRTNKQLFKDIVSEEGPDIAFATRDATRASGDLLRDAQVVAYLRGVLESSRVADLFPTPFVDHVTENLSVAASTGKDSVFSQRRVLRSLKRRLPERIQRLGKRALQQPNMPPNRSAFRIYLVAEMHETLASDAAFFKR